MKECKFCQGTDDIIDKGNTTKRIIVGLDCNYLMVDYFDDNKNAYGSAQKKIKYCPMCGRKLEEAKDDCRKS